MRHLSWLLLPACSSDVVHDHFNVLVDGAVLPVEVHGYLGGGTLVLVESGGPSGPGIAERAVGYHPFQGTLEREVAVAWYDRRGTGNAAGDYGVEDQSIDQLIVDLDAVIDVLIARYAPDHVLLLGHSFGTYTSGLYLLDRPGKVDGWVAAGPSIIEGPDDLFVPYRRDFACRVGDEQRADGRTDALWADLAAFCAANPTLPPSWDTPEREELRHVPGLPDLQRVAERQLERLRRQVLTAEDGLAKRRAWRGARVARAARPGSARGWTSSTARSTLTEPWICRQRP